MNLDHYIAELLTTHDCVIIPDFGGFIGNYAPARINPINHRFDPPYRKISFNKLLTHNDGLLAAHIARIENESFESALNSLKDYSIYLKATLKSDQRISFDKIGVLYQNPDGSLRFEQFSDVEFSQSSFGLGSFFGQKITRSVAPPPAIEPKKELNPAFVPPVVVKEDIEPKNEANDEVVAPVIAINKEPKKPKRKFKVIRAAAALLALPVLGYAIYLSLETPLFKADERFHYSDLNPFIEKACPEYELNRLAPLDSELSPPISLSLMEKKGFIEIFESEARDKTLVVSLEEKIELIEQGVELLPYHIIGGCFSEENNANGMVSKYQTAGSNASIVGRVNDLYRVSVASFGTKKEAMQELASVRNEIPNAWILYK